MDIFLNPRSCRSLIQTLALTAFFDPIGAEKLTDEHEEVLRLLSSGIARHPTLISISIGSPTLWLPPTQTFLAVNRRLETPGVSGLNLNSNDVGRNFGQFFSTWTSAICGDGREPTLQAIHFDLCLFAKEINSPAIPSTLLIQPQLAVVHITSTFDSNFTSYVVTSLFRSLAECEQIRELTSRFPLVSVTLQCSRSIRL